MKEWDRERESEVREGERKIRKWIKRARYEKEVREGIRVG